MSVIPEHYLDLLQATALAHVATKGEPQSTPVWFGWDGTHILFSQITGRQKYRNLLRDPRIVQEIVDPANPYRFIEVRGKVLRIDEDPEYRFLNSMTKKYTNQDVYSHLQPGEERVVIIVGPKHM